MRGASSVIGFGVLGLFTLFSALYLNGQTGWCREKPATCSTVIATDPGSLAGEIALGFVVLVALMLVANGVVRVLSYRRSEG